MAKWNLKKFNRYQKNQKNSISFSTGTNPTFAGTWYSTFSTFYTNKNRQIFYPKNQ
jgi:hypothetical protein